MFGSTWQERNTRVSRWNQWTKKYSCTFQLCLITRRDGYCYSHISWSPGGENKILISGPCPPAVEVFQVLCLRHPQRGLVSQAPEEPVPREWRETALSQMQLDSIATLWSSLCWPRGSLQPTKPHATAKPFLCWDSWPNTMLQWLCSQ